MSRPRFALTTALAICAGVSTVAVDLSAAPTVFRTGVTIHEPALVEPGYVLYTGPDGVARLIDTNGQRVHLWRADLPGYSMGYTRPLANGNVLTRITGPTPDRIVEMDWDGNVVWQFEEPAGVNLHHDHSKLPNGNYLLLCSRQIDVPAISDQTLVDDCLLEVDPAGNIVWDWQTADHFDDFSFSDEVKQGIFDAGGDWAHANSASAIPLDTSHVDPRFAPGNVIVSYRFISSVAIVDRTTGSIDWRTGGHTVGQHDAKMLPDSLPGGGNLLVFDNGYGERYDPRFGAKNHSEVVEIDPTDFSEPYVYDAEDSGLAIWMFYSWFISGAERLANGNTLIDEGAFGRIFEVTPSGQIVWEFVSRAFNLVGPLNNRVYRAHKVALDWPPR